MARLIETVSIEVESRHVWAALNNVAGLAQMVPQLVESCTFDDATLTRTVIFRNGQTLIEPIIAQDPETQTIAWTAKGGGWDHHNASATVRPNGDHACTVRWIADVLPDSEAPTITAIMQAGLAAMKETLEVRHGT